jgi:hypothetical protein
VVYYKAEIRTLLQKLLDFAESIAFYGSDHSMELPRLNRLFDRLTYYSTGSAFFYHLINWPIALLGVMGGFLTYILPAVFFFWLRSEDQQTPSDATDYLGIISFYGFLFAQLASVMYVTQPAMIAANLGHRLFQLRSELRDIAQVPCFDICLLLIN